MLVPAKTQLLIRRLLYNEGEIIPMLLCKHKWQFHELNAAEVDHSDNNGTIAIGFVSPWVAFSELDHYADYL